MTRSDRPARPVPPLVFSDRDHTVDQPITKAGSTLLVFREPQ